MEAAGATKEMCALCFDVLLAKLKNQDVMPYIERFLEAEPLAEAVFPLFVTWTIGRDKDLRGCIGTFDGSESLSALLPRYAIISATEDSRFDPVTLRETEHMHVGVSLLVNFRDISDPFDWEVGRHGIDIELKDGGRKYKATFLPEVAHEQGWDQATTFVQLFKKAGYRPRNPKLPASQIVSEVQANLKVRTYESHKSALSYAEYTAYRATIDSS